jgi:hypothetical protein
MNKDRKMSGSAMALEYFNGISKGIIIIIIITITIGVWGARWRSG